MKWLDKIIALWSSNMRSTLELQKLNALWSRFNNGENVRDELQNKKWKYHQEQVKMLEDFHIFLK